MYITIIIKHIIKQMKYWNKFLNLLDQRAEAFGVQYKAFAIFVIITYPLAYFFLYHIEAQTHESLTVRLISFLLCIPLLFSDYWPGKTKKYLNLYWYLTVLYCLPFLGTYMLLQNQMSSEWLMNIVLGLFLLILLVDWITFIILLSIGVLLGYLCFIINGSDFMFHKSFSEISLYIYMYIYVILIGGIFARNHEHLKNAKFYTMKMLAGSIAHELRTPLSAIRAVGNNLNLIVNKYQNLEEEQSISKKDIQYLQKFSEDLNSLVNKSNHTIDVMLANLREDMTAIKLEPLSIRKCAESAIEQYPFTEQERELVHVRIDDDFIIIGNPDLMLHVFFNLIRNSTYAIQQSGKGEIFIETQLEKYENTLILKDTASGISPKILTHLFEPFYTDRPQGTGIGLPYCKRALEFMGGKIDCQSIEGEYTIFYIRFSK